MKKELDETKVRRLKTGLTKIQSKYRCRLSKNERKVLRDVNRFLSKVTEFLRDGAVGS